MSGPDRRKRGARGIFAWRKGLVLVLGLAAALPGGAMAGAWDRAEGTGFASAAMSWELRQADISAALAGTAPLPAPRRADSLYLEYGLGMGLTLGASHYRKTTQQRGDSTLFLRHRLMAPRGGHHLAAAAGLSLPDTGGAALQPGIFWGKGFDGALGPGWLGADVWAAFEGGGAPALKGDLTLGFNRDGGRMTIFQLQGYRSSEGDPTWRAASSLVLPAGKRRKIELKALQEVNGTRRLGLSLGLWHEF